MNELANCCTLVTFLITGFGIEGADDPPLTTDQQLVVAAFELAVKRVESLLEEGANPNARFGIYKGQSLFQELFKDKWTLGTPMASYKWTPLLAVASSHREPQPEKPTENTMEGRALAIRKRDAIDPKLIAERDARRKTIAKLLIDANADLDLDDGHGATALAEAVDNDYKDLALLLIQSGAKVNTKTGIYFDGTGDITPLHRATSNPTVLKALLERGAEVNVRDSAGETPLHWAARHNAESVKLLLEAGANPSIKDKEGRTPSYWAPTNEGLAFPAAAEKKQVRNRLEFIEGWIVVVLLCGFAGALVGIGFVVSRRRRWKRGGTDR
jgi:hypothetical protein